MLPIDPKSNPGVHHFTLLLPSSITLSSLSQTFAGPWCDRQQRTRLSAHYQTVRDPWNTSSLRGVEWKIPLVKTTKETLNTTGGIANFILPSLPKSFQDAAKVAMNLGLRYLWIDSLCIVQDDPLDWEEEAAKMGSIFESSYVAIAATSAIRSTVGFLSQQEDPHEITGTNSDESQFSVFVRKRITKEDHEWLLLPYNARNGGKEVHPLLERG
jgi:hypothetical protein